MTMTQPDTPEAIFNAAASPDWQDIPEITQKRSDQDFQRTLTALIKETEDTRVRYMQRYQTRGFIATSLSLILAMVGAGAFGWYLLMEANLAKAVACMLLAVVIPALLHSWPRGVLRQYILLHKLEFMPRIAHALGGLKFYPLRGINEAVLPKTGILPDFAAYDAEDCFAGRYKGVKVMFSEARLFSDRGMKSEVFRGMLVLLEMPADTFKGHTIVTADKAMARAWSHTRWSKLQPLHLSVSNPQWDMFDAYSDAPDRAHAILSDALLKELAEAAEIFKNAPLSMALFRGKHVFMAIPYEQDMFEPSNIYVPVTSHKHAMNCKREVERILEIIDVFELMGGSA